jgi:hypothetical protein
MTIAYRPSAVFTRNRPESLENEWSKYPIWQDNALLTNGRMEPSVSVISLMTDQDTLRICPCKRLWNAPFGKAKRPSANRLHRSQRPGKWQSAWQGALQWLFHVTGKT